MTVWALITAGSGNGLAGLDECPSTFYMITGIMFYFIALSYAQILRIYKCGMTVCDEMHKYEFLVK